VVDAVAITALACSLAAAGHAVAGVILLAAILSLQLGILIRLQKRFDRCAPGAAGARPGEPLGPAGPLGSRLPAANARRRQSLAAPIDRFRALKVELASRQASCRASNSTESRARARRWPAWEATADRLWFATQ
jgi:hypothetical protein